jgi:hypothetical protein
VSGRPYIGAAFRTIESGSAIDLDPDLLPTADRALLRLLARHGVLTAAEAGQFIYTDHRRAQEHVLRLYRASLLERTPLSRQTAGRAQQAYRLSELGHQRLGTRRATAPASYVRHSIDTARAICALNRADDREHAPVQLWFPDSMTGDVLSRFVRPDSIAVVTTDAGSAVLALEIDEGTEHMRMIRAKLAAYRLPLSRRPAWHLIVVVPGPLRAEWMVRQSVAVNLGERCWVLTHADLARDSLDAMLRPLDPGQSPTSIRSLLKPPHRWLPAPVGSQAWLELLATGGGEIDDGALAP